MTVIDIGASTAYPESRKEERTLYLPPRPKVKIDNSDMIFRGPMSQFVEDFIAIEGNPFSFGGREYLRPIHDESYDLSKKTILRTGRQVEKCLSPLVSRVYMANGSEKLLGDVVVGDAVLSYDDKLKKTTDEVIAIHDNGTRDVYKVSTRLGHEIYATGSHRLRCLYDFAMISDLDAGSMVAGVRRGGEFTGTSSMTESEAKAIAYIIGDGCLRWENTKRFGFTNSIPEILSDYKRCIEAIDKEVKWFTYREDKTDLIGGSDVVKKLLVLNGLWGLGSADKHIPSEVFDLDRDTTISFLNALWSTDGHVAQATPSKYDVEYSSINRALVKQVQNLLYKFGIPSVIREFTPTLYKGTDKRGYSVRIITQEGVRTFLTEIGALGKSENIPLPDKTSNNNRDSIPKEIGSYLRDICPSRKGQNLSSNSSDTSLYQKGLRLTPKYNMTYGKAREYIEFFDSEGIDCQFLKDLVDSDVIWDQISSIEYIGEEHVYDIETKEHHNYVVDGIITHNSSTLAMKLIAHCAIYPWFKTLYVSPSQMQTRQFSADRVRASYERSPRINKLFTAKGVTDQVFDKRLANGAMMYFRYAFLTPDRCRGLSTDFLLIDEIQDILTDNIPVIRECLSHSSFKKELYSGTPKTTSNAIEFYWDMSTKNEWLVKCQWCNYWNLLGMDNIGTDAIICSKCGRPINPRIGQWVTMHKDAKWEGFRISQLMVPWVTFEDIKDKLEDYPTSRFYNEVLGLPYDSGVKPITESQLRACCTFGNIMRDPDPVKLNLPVFAGIDWGTGGISGEGNPSYTILSFGAFFTPGVFTIFYIKKFEGREADLLNITGLIGQLMRRFNMTFTCSDWGFGAALNLQLRQAWGIERIAEVQYVSQGVPLKYDSNNFRYRADRTSIMTEFIHSIKKQKLQFFDWPDFKEFGMDFLNIDSEYNDRTQKMSYNHRPDRPDDSFHASLYCWLAGNLYYKTITPR